MPQRVRLWIAAVAAIAATGLTAGLAITAGTGSPGQIAADDVSKGGRVIPDNWAVLEAATYQGTGVRLRYSTLPSL
jgi:hypothetical protein